MPSSPPSLLQSSSPASTAQAPRTAVLNHFVCTSRGAWTLFVLRTKHKHRHPKAPVCAEKMDGDDQEPYPSLVTVLQQWGSELLTINPGALASLRGRARAGTTSPLPHLPRAGNKMGCRPGP